MLLTARSASAFVSDPHPVQPAGAGPVGGTGEAVPAVRPGRTILLVEDDPVVRHVVKLLLELEGDAVLEAKDGDDALTVLAGHTGALDLLLTDVMMPGLSGAEVCDKVRANRPGLPTLFISGFYPEAVFPDQRLPAGSAFLAKPFMPEDLIEAVDLLLAKVTGEPRRVRVARPRRT